MDIKRCFSLGITVLVIVAAIVLINVLPIWSTLYAVLAFAAGAVSGYLFKKPEVVIETVEKIVEVTKPKKAKTTKKVE